MGYVHKINIFSQKMMLKIGILEIPPCAKPFSKNRSWKSRCLPKLQIKMTFFVHGGISKKKKNSGIWTYDK